VVIELRALRADGHNEADPDRCWADNEAPGAPWACGSTDVDPLGLCAWHREKLFGDAALTREPDTR
jgi:hypothetical protein